MSRSKKTKALIALAVVAFLWLLTRPFGRPIGGNWYIRDIPRLPEAGFTRYELYHRSGILFRHVDTEVGVYRFYPEDCIVYAAIHAASHGAGHIFAACGKRTPIEIMDHGASWQIRPEGIVLTKGAYDFEGTNRKVDKGLVKPIGDVFALAKKQPRFASGWEARDRFTGDRVKSVEPTY